MSAQSTEWNVEASFEAKVVRGDGCWEWRASHYPSGYGQLWDGSRIVVAHRWSYEHFVGPIPEGLQIDHLCRNRGCVNPTHLEPVTPRENTLRGMSPAAISVRTNRCRKGHEWTIENSGLTARGTRFCRTCQRKREAGRHWRRKGEKPEGARTLWTTEELAAVIAADRPDDHALAAQIGRSVNAIRKQRSKLTARAEAERRGERP